ncbi:hypothetical protein IW140_005156 [Coemansia sp. RSA 1813]|nr:hypothetical protein EV178_005133 [Coemansia sp. RSA 1646]KAJ1768107.1 hypothetical protein LPJ74_005006 [Coemansia sp. RSA 1843]KAJ2088036.1 hypothetical protein IW138_004544 [Coemansia sp. RSA 986]KAJ2211946.1 hypothetical protein EV179_005053 [Coemansia sp. RSA 487]KAJ2565874.1 hypothetical protein IW140_005156 [Coemansia sp. RSA 1813]
MRKSGAKPTKKPLLGAGVPSSQFSSFSISNSKTAVAAPGSRGGSKASKAIDGFGDDENEDAHQPTPKEIQLDSESMDTEEKTLLTPRSIQMAKKPNSVLNAARPNIKDLPDSTEISSYERVPVEDFGMMMLRGMGLTESKGSTDIQHEETPRPSLLGLGAKPRPQDGPSVSSSRPKRYA